ncbi:hypothetical protein JCM19235_1926 [Vibrio maritimus]|uniref:Uncharacterized protein n=1 Tax=Vibrio maritimus TaxID=990268 RepID=A0A090RVF0_9VIBR|nr:hypothetical protein JCM19235_1926 [Vibrio maritimus]
MAFLGVANGSASAFAGTIQVADLKQSSMKKMMWTPAPYAERSPTSKEHTITAKPARTKTLGTITK